MSAWESGDRHLAVEISRLVFANPFQPGHWAQGFQKVIDLAGTNGRSFPPVESVTEDGRQQLGHWAEQLLVSARDAWAAGASIGDEDRRLYQDLVLVAMYFRNRASFQELLDLGNRDALRFNAMLAQVYREFERTWQSQWRVNRLSIESDHACHHAFACLFLIRRAYHQISSWLWGSSTAMGRLRAEIWQSVFSHDFRRFGLLLFDRMEDITTLIAGPSGTGKELVARAIGQARYIPFDPKSRQFAESYASAFHPVNLSALAESIVESELFGHAKGAFTGAITGRTGIFELCRAGHTVFLDEIGELSPALQVKLLRVVQSREFRRLGETKLRSFGGKLIVATNRDFSSELAEGRFREDLYYRLCSDVVRTPSLAEQVQGNEVELRSLVVRVAQKQLGDASVAEEIADDVMAWVRDELGLEYAWPGNFRELEQCVRNVMIRQSYRPLDLASGAADPFIANLKSGRLTADQLLVGYCQRVYRQTGSYKAAAEILGLDQRTVKKHVVANGSMPIATR